MRATGSECGGDRGADRLVIGRLEHGQTVRTSDCPSTAAEGDVAPESGRAAGL